VADRDARHYKAGRAVPRCGAGYGGGLSAERFAREAKLAARLQQANIVPLLSAGEANGRPYYTMPYVRGQSLRSRLTSDDALPLPEATGILRDVARALAYAHAEGVVHRDIQARKHPAVRAGARDEAAAANHSIESQAKAPGALGGLPMAYLAIGDIEHALKTMEAVAGDGDMFLAGVPSMPIYDPVRGNPRFAAVLLRFNLDVARLTKPDGGRSR
jgi:hypothetical protein